jgi:hypothetical protein
MMYFDQKVIDHVACLALGMDYPLFETHDARNPQRIISFWMESDTIGRHRSN